VMELLYWRLGFEAEQVVQQMLKKNSLTIL